MQYSLFIGFFFFWLSLFFDVIFAFKADDMSNVTDSLTPILSNVGTTLANTVNQTGLVPVLENLLTPISDAVVTHMPLLPNISVLGFPAVDNLVVSLETELHNVIALPVVSTLMNDVTTITNNLLTPVTNALSGSNVSSSNTGTAALPLPLDNAATAVSALLSTVLSDVNTTILAPIDHAIPAINVNYLSVPVVDNVLTTVANHVLPTTVSTLDNNVLNPLLTAVGNNVLNPVVSTLSNNVLNPLLSTVDHNVLQPVLSTVSHSVLAPVLTTVDHNVLSPVLSTVSNHVLTPVLSTVDHNVLQPVLNTLGNSVVAPVLNTVANTVLKPVLSTVDTAVLNPVLSALSTPLPSLGNQLPLTTVNALVSTIASLGSSSTHTTVAPVAISSHINSNYGSII